MTRAYRQDLARAYVDLDYGVYGSSLSQRPNLTEHDGTWQPPRTRTGSNLQGLQAGSWAQGNRMRRRRHAATAGRGTGTGRGGAGQSRRPLGSQSGTLLAGHSNKTLQAWQAQPSGPDQPVSSSLARSPSSAVSFAATGLAKSIARWQVAQLHLLYHPQMQAGQCRGG